MMADEDGEVMGTTHGPFLSRSEADTHAFAAALSEALEPGDVVALEGTLGAGKTVLVRGVAKALGVTDGVSSPTYALVNLYDGGRLGLAHLDLYRLGDPDELEAIGWRDLLQSDRVMLVEWPERGDILIDATFVVRLEDLGPAIRRLSINARDPEASLALALALAALPPRLLTAAAVEPTL
ncbi:MAG: tRNA threonylcarbamoyladenosine biosynthesis protein TsaE [Myxococcota bacterium]|jgi:tRNA threonylcarbamoyladenosine biosynthesis protein TsaE